MTSEFHQSVSDRRVGERRAVMQAVPSHQEWHLDKKVPLSLIFAMLVQFSMALMAYSDLKKDVAVLQADGVVLHQRDAQNFDALNAAMKTVNETFARMDAKLDRIIERGQK